MNDNLRNAKLQLDYSDKSSYMLSLKYQHILNQQAKRNEYNLKLLENVQLLQHYGEYGSWLYQFGILLALNWLKDWRKNEWKGRTNRSEHESLNYDLSVAGVRV